ncbi:hypothetical protein MBLNU459_g0029t1 [Dothideomycetes sp. NU459]
MSPSLYSIFAAGLAAFAPLASAYTKPVGASPEGNPIYEPGLNSVVPAGKPFTITWNATTDGNVALVLLKGPSTNAVPIRTIAESIDNSGSYVWTPATDLSPGTTGYGIELIVEATGQYQYSTQFGISNPSYNGLSSSSSAAAADSTASAAIDAAIDAANSTATATTSATAYKVTGVPSSGWLPANGTYPKPTGNVTVPSSLKTASQTTLTSVKTASTDASATATGASSTGSSASASATQTGAASHVGASVGGLILAAGVAVFAL